MSETINKIILHATVLKTQNYGYVAILSDDSIDRENEIVGKSFLQKALDEYVPGMVNHENDALGQVCEWTDKKITMIDGHNTLTAKPKWFMSNPNAKIFKGMLDEGAEIGLSIGAIPSDSDIVKIAGKEYKRWTDGEFLEASFVGIPANKNAKIRAIAKALKLEIKAAHPNTGKPKPGKPKPAEDEDDEEDEKKKKEPKESLETEKVMNDRINFIHDRIDNISSDTVMGRSKDSKINKSEAQKMSDAEKLKKEAEEIIEVSKNKLIANLEKAKIPEDIIKSVMQKDDEETPSGDKPADEGKDKPAEGGDEEKKSYSEAEITKLINVKVEEKLKDSPIYKQENQGEPAKPSEEGGDSEAEKKADELLEKGMIPIIH